MRPDILIHFIILLGGIQGVVLGLVHSGRSRSWFPSRYLGLALVTHALSDIYLWLYWTNGTVELRLLRLLPLNVVLVPVACLVRYMEGFVEARPRIRKYHWFLGVAASAELVAYLLPAGAALYQQHITPAVLEFAKLVRTTLNVCTVPVCLLAGYRLQQLIRQYRQHLAASPAYYYRVRWLQQLFAGAGLLYGVAQLPLLVALVSGWHSRVLYYPLGLFSSFFLVAAGLRAFAIHDRLRDDALAAEATRVATNPAPSTEATEWSSQEALYQQAVQVIEREQLYREPDLKLADVAARLSVSPHHLSRIINQRAQKSFTDLINAYRVAEVKQLMDNPAFAHYTLESLGLEAGFGAKSTYQASFKRITGLTPSQYRAGGRPAS